MKYSKTCNKFCKFITNSVIYYLFIYFNLKNNCEIAFKNTVYTEVHQHHISKIKTFVDPYM